MVKSKKNQVSPLRENRYEEMILSSLDQMQQEISSLRQDISNMKADVRWIKGKLEGRAETRHLVLTVISIAAASGY